MTMPMSMPALLLPPILHPAYLEHARVDDAHVHARLDGVVEEDGVHGLRRGRGGTHTSDADNLPI